MKDLDSETLLALLAEDLEGRDQGQRRELPAELREELAMYRAGLANPATEAAIEGALREHPEARGHLRDLAGVAPEGLPREARRQVLEAYRRAGRGARKGSAPSLRPVGSGIGWRLPLSLAASLLLTVGLAWTILRGGLPVDLAYQLSAQGKATSRSTTGSPSSLAEDGGVIEAFPNTVVRVVLRPLRAANHTVDVGIFAPRAEGEGLHLDRIDRPETTSLVNHRGALSLSASAASWVGETPGTYRLFVAVTARGKLPETIELGKVEATTIDLEALQIRGRRLVYPLTLELLQEAEEKHQ